MTRDELLNDIATEVKSAMPENEPLDSDNIDTLRTVIETTLDSAEETVDESAEEEEAESTK